ncbi:hypothetical protein C2E23DRAFT_942080 [Lenzites betulinus]|nr:hypothetical protein C2E23DRAFT_942080 [Lenzites betulinus]
MPAKRASKSTAYEKHLWTLDKPTAGRKRGQSNASIHEADAAPAGKKTKSASHTQHLLLNDTADMEDDIQPRPPAKGAGRRRRFSAPKLTIESDDEEADAHVDIIREGDSTAVRASRSGQQKKGVTSKNIGGTVGSASEGDEEDEVGGSGSDVDNLEEDSGSERSADVEWVGLSQKARMAETPTWVEDNEETEELSPAPAEKLRTGRATHRRHTSTTSVSSAAANPPSSADGDSGFEAVGFGLDLESHRELRSESEAESINLSHRQAPKSAAVYGYRRGSATKSKKRSRAESAREAETPQWEETAKLSEDERDSWHKHHELYTTVIATF